jgi:hypothetical protein
MRAPNFFLGTVVVSLSVMLGQACSGAAPDSGFGAEPPDGGSAAVRDGSGGSQNDAANIGDANFGSSDSGGSTGDLDAGCATATAKAAPQPVYMLFVLDGSGSMKQQNKWTAVSAALDSIFDQFSTQADTNFGAGILAFSDSRDPTCGGVFGGCVGPYPSNVDVPVAYVDSTQHGKLRGRIDGANANGDTPTHAALIGGYSELESFTAAAPLKPGGKKVLVILTDGVPTDGSNTQCIQAAGQELTKVSPQGPITTFVIGVGVFPSSNTQSYDPSFLGQLAQAGGAAPQGCNPTENANAANVCYFQIDPSGSQTVAQLTQKFVDAINAIRGKVASCEFLLEKPDGGGQIDPGKVNVVYDDGQGHTTTLVPDPVNGWTYDDPNNPTKVILHGVACDNIKVTGGSVSVVLGCKTIPPH